MDIKARFSVFIIVALFCLYVSAEVVTGEVDTMSWDYVMSQEWKRPEKLDTFAGVHPRYLLTKHRLEMLKGKINTTHKKMWEVVKEKADSYRGKPPPSNYNRQGPMRLAGRAIPPMALAYLLTGDSAYFDDAKRWILAICSYPKWENNKSLAAGECLFGVSIGYDWLYDKLTEEERDYIRKKLMYQAEVMKDGPPVHHDRWIANHNHVEYNGLAAAGFVLYDEVPEAIEWIRHSDLVLGQAFKVSGPDGTSEEGHQYWAYSTESLLSYAEAARDLMGINYYDDNEFLKNAANFIIYSTIPDFDAESSVMCYGDARRNYSSRSPIYILYRLASEYKDGFAQWLADEMVKRDVDREAYRTWCNLIWCDESVRPISISNLPTFKHFDNIGWVTARSGWDKDGIMIGFRCGPFHGHKIQAYYEKQVDKGWPVNEIGGGHCHPDINSFQIYAYGRWLATYPGYERPKWTKNHSTILVDGVGQLGEGRTWFDRRSAIKAKAKSTIIKADSRKDYDYIIGDAGNIYPQSTGLEKFYRHLVHIKPDLILVVDELKAESASQFEWRLNAGGGIRKKGATYFMIRNKDVVMDAHIVYPKKIDTIIDGDFLRVLPEKTTETVIVTVLHPRRIKEAASRITKVSLKDSVVDLTIKCGRQVKKVKLDLVKQEVSL